MGCGFGSDLRHRRHVKKRRQLDFCELAETPRRTQHTVEVYLVRLASGCSSVAFSTAQRRPPAASLLGDRSLGWNHCHVLTTFHHRTLTGHDGIIECVAFSPRDGERLLASGSDDMAVRAVGHADQEVCRCGHRVEVMCVALSPTAVCWCQRLMTRTRQRDCGVWQRGGRPRHRSALQELCCIAECMQWPFHPAATCLPHRPEVVYGCCACRRAHQGLCCVMNMAFIVLPSRPLLRAACWQRGATTARSCCGMLLQLMACLAV
jgi:hypothetical protein